MRDPRLLAEAAIITMSHTRHRPCGRLFGHITAQSEIIAAALKEAEGMEHEFDCEATIRQSECSGNGKCNCVRRRLIAILKGEQK